MPKLTPLMRQYFEIKRQHEDAILLFHLGDFYEMFHDDARDAARILNIALTSRDKNKADSIPLCGIPCHAAESYINRLLAAGRKVAICDQVEDASASRGLVKRAVTRIITAGTVLDDRLLEGKANNYAMAVCREGSLLGAAALDLSTGRFLYQEFAAADGSELGDLTAVLEPSEIILPPGGDDLVEGVLANALPHLPPTVASAEFFDPHLARQLLLEHFSVATLDGFGCSGVTAGVTAAGALLAYARDTQRRALLNVARLERIHPHGRMVIDAATQRNLEIVRGLECGGREGSLFAAIDRTRTAMGGRLLQRWLLSPLLDRDALGGRHDAVGELAAETDGRSKLESALHEVYDMERLSSRISLNSCTPRDLAALRHSLARLPLLVSSLRTFSSPLLEAYASLDTLTDIHDLVAGSLVEDPPLKIKEGGLIRSGYSSELDDLREISKSARGWLSDFEARERDRTGIPTLKTGYNKVYGYYVEVTKTHSGKVPDDYTRKQTLVNAERYLTPDLSVFEEKILGADEKISALELEIFEALRRRIAAEASRILETAEAVAAVDVLASLARIAVEKNYCRPEISEDPILHVVEGRHPVVEESCDGRFVPNDTSLDSRGCQIMIITGPNMAGKSTYLRQVALVSLLAQVGSFVPAAEATLGIVDRIFTRIGASDKLSRGQSTFMVEMIETATILHGATDRSLVILDEVGRGTSTFDGLSIAWAIVEKLHGSSDAGPRTLFATHYHQLTDLPLTLRRAKNFSIAVREWEGRIMFLHRIVEGGTDKSYGIHVAQLAGLPAETVSRAREILANLEEGVLNLEGTPRLAQRETDAPPPQKQLELYAAPADRVIEELRRLDTDETTPLEALGILARLKRDIDNDGRTG
jgi:DNA mismatch repair protein MutS